MEIDYFDYSSLWPPSLDDTEIIGQKDESNLPAQSDEDSFNMHLSVTFHGLDINDTDDENEQKLNQSMKSKEFPDKSEDKPVKNRKLTYVIRKSEEIPVNSDETFDISQEMEENVDIPMIKCEEVKFSDGVFPFKKEIPVDFDETFDISQEMEENVDIPVIKCEEVKFSDGVFPFKKEIPVDFDHTQSGSDGFCDVSPEVEENVGFFERKSEELALSDDVFDLKQEFSPDIIETSFKFNINKPGTSKTDDMNSYFQDFQEREKYEENIKPNNKISKQRKTTSKPRNHNKVKSVCKQSTKPEKKEEKVENKPEIAEEVEEDLISRLIKTEKIKEKVENATPDMKINQKTALKAPNRYNTRSKGREGDETTENVESENSGNEISMKKTKNVKEREQEKKVKEIKGRTAKKASRKVMQEENVPVRRSERIRTKAYF